MNAQGAAHDQGALAVELPMPAPLRLSLALIALAAPGLAQAPGLPAPRPPVIVLSAGHAAQGWARYEIHATDRIVIRQMNPGGSLEQRRFADRPGAYARAAAFLASDGVRRLWQDAPPRTPCPGSLDAIEAIPPVSGFSAFRPGCPGGEDAFWALFGGLVAAIMPR
jgi:hypothetical protein